MVASAEAGTVNKATTRGNWGPSVSKTTAQRHGAPVADTTKRGSKVRRKQLPNRPEGQAGWKSVGKTLKNNGFPIMKQPHQEVEH